MRAGLLAAFILSTGISAASAEDDTASTDTASANDIFAFQHVSCTGADNEIRIIVTGVKDNVGLMTAELFPDKEDGFLRGRNRIKRVRFAAKSPETKFCLTAPQAGRFAIAAYHDENANEDFDKNGLGLPAEPWGLSRNPKIRFRMPSVEETVFEVTPDDGAEIVINLN